MDVVPGEQANYLGRQLTAMRFTSSSYRLVSWVKLSAVKKTHPEMGGCVLEAYSAVTNFRAKWRIELPKGRIH